MDVKRRGSDLLVGLFLIVFGSIYLLQTVGLIPEFAPSIWGMIFTAAAAVFLLIYLISGWRAWGWLFPTSIFAGLAMTLYLTERSPVDGLLVGAQFMGWVSLPFWLAFVINRKTNRWALIPGWTTAVIAAIILLSDRIPGELLAGFILGGIGLPFFIVYLLNRKHWWALIPALILTGIGLAVSLADRVSGVMVGSMVLFAIGLPFLLLYFRSSEHWWAVIPATIMMFLALVTLLADRMVQAAWGPNLLSLVIFLGVASPFGFLWLRQNRYQTRWAKYPAAGLVLMGILSFFVQPLPVWIWGAALVLSGGWLLLDALQESGLKG